MRRLATLIVTSGLLFALSPSMVLAATTTLICAYSPPEPNWSPAVSFVLDEAASKVTINKAAFQVANVIVPAASDTYPAIFSTAVITIKLPDRQGLTNFQYKIDRLTGMVEVTGDPKVLYHLACHVASAQF